MIRDNHYFTQLTSTIPTYAIWDDHDFGKNDSDGSNKTKDAALKAFNEYWPNPKKSDREENGIYTSFVINNIEIFMLDTRYHSNKDKKNPTLLGEKQFSWLCRGLKASKARYKVIASGVPLAFPKSAWREAATKMSAQEASDYLDEWVFRTADELDQLAREAQLEIEPEVSQILGALL